MKDSMIVIYDKKSTRKVFKDYAETLFNSLVKSGLTIDYFKYFPNINHGGLSIRDSTSYTREATVIVSIHTYEGKIYVDVIKHRYSILNIVDVRTFLEDLNKHYIEYDRLNN